MRDSVICNAITLAWCVYLTISVQFVDWIDKWMMMVLASCPKPQLPIFHLLISSLFSDHLLLSLSSSISTTFNSINTIRLLTMENSIQYSSKRILQISKNGVFYQLMQFLIGLKIPIRMFPTDNIRMPNLSMFKERTLYFFKLQKLSILFLSLVTS